MDFIYYVKTIKKMISRIKCNIQSDRKKYFLWKLFRPFWKDYKISKNHVFVNIPFFKQTNTGNRGLFLPFLKTLLLAWGTTCTDATRAKLILQLGVQNISTSIRISPTDMTDRRGKHKRFPNPSPNIVSRWLITSGPSLPICKPKPCDEIGEKNENNRSKNRNLKRSTPIDKETDCINHWLIRKN